MKWNYGDSWERFPIEPGERWTETKTGSMVIVNNLMNGLPEWFLLADMVYIDPPWNDSNVSSFYTKNNEKADISYNQLMDKIFEIVAWINPMWFYMECSVKNVNALTERANTIFNYAAGWDIKYYRRNPSGLVYGGIEPVEYDFSGVDDEFTPGLAIQYRADKIATVADFCMGRGLTAVSAFNRGKRFLGGEMNKRRLAVTIDKISKLGGNWERG